MGKGGQFHALMAELYGRAPSVGKGRGGSMHLADRGFSIVGESSILGGGIPLATGCGSRH